TISASTARNWARARRRSPSSPAHRRSRPRREETTTPSVSVSAAKMRLEIVPHALWPPQPATAPRTRGGERLFPHRGQPGRLPAATQSRLRPPRPGRLACHRPLRGPLRPRLRHRPVPRRPQPERLHPHRLAGQHAHIMIDHRERLLLIRQVDPDHRAISRPHRTKPLTPRIAPPVPTGRAATTLAHRDVLSGCVWDTKPALSHQEDVP